MQLIVQVLRNQRFCPLLPQRHFIEMASSPDGSYVSLKGILKFKKSLALKVLAFPLTCFAAVLAFPRAGSYVAEPLSSSAADKR
jgi:hypothetical protein